MATRLAPVQGAVNDEASRAGREDSNLQPLREMFDLVVFPVVPAEERDTAWREHERVRLHIDRPDAPGA